MSSVGSVEGTVREPLHDFRQARVLSPCYQISGSLLMSNLHNKTYLIPEGFADHAGA